MTFQSLLHGHTLYLLKPSLFWPLGGKQNIEILSLYEVNVANMLAFIHIQQTWIIISIYLHWSHKSGQLMNVPAIIMRHEPEIDLWP